MVQDPIRVQDDGVCKRVGAKSFSAPYQVVGAYRLAAAWSLFTTICCNTVCFSVTLRSRDTYEHILKIITPGLSWLAGGHV
ncbi:hypothetical protein RRG08_013898 [Elysia crispata]|uniref:Uncharacterized protein n=1 Tax=Elysia crispata TaxID=231223 RepID=A0AAE0ZHR1_9GAST|nr:hypothetical protein RRG08_013898 [Elysia crispata]